MRAALITVVAAIAIVCAIYADLVADIRTPRSALAQQHVVASNWSFLTADYDRVSNEMKQRYGEGAKTSLDAGKGWIEVRLDGKTVHDQKFTMTIENVFGAFFIGADGPAQQTFLFDMKAGHLPEPDRTKSLTELVKQRFANGGGKLISSLAESDWSPGPCRVVNPATLGFGQLARTLRFEAATTCLVSSRKDAGSLMRVAVVAARGDPWMRPFSRRICGIVGSKLLAEPAEGGKPNYFGCILIDRPARTGAREILVTHMFEAAPNGRLAVVQ